MPLSDITGELIVRAARFLGHIVLEGVLEVLVRGPGYLICRIFKKDVDPEGGLVACVGILFWIVLTVSAWSVYQWVSEAIDIDRCLDSGGAFDRRHQKCVS